MGYDDTVGAKLKGKKKEIFYFIIIVKETIYYIHRILLNPLIEESVDWGPSIVRSVYSGIWMD